MRIVHVNLFDALGGAASTAWILMNHMSSQGHDVHIFAHHKTRGDSRVIPLEFPDTRWQKRLLTKQAGQGLFDLYSAALLTVLEHPLYEEADILHLHCINGGYFSFLLLPFLTAKPTVWTFHDPLPFTAGCYNTDDCRGWQGNWCKNCPLDGQGQSGKPQRELLQLLKASIYKMVNFTAVCPSLWLQKQVESSVVKNQPTRLIPYGIDINLFSPGNQQEIRCKLGLPTDQPIIMFAAHGGLNDGRKGGRFLIEALGKIQNKYPTLLLLNIGTYDNAITAQLTIRHMDLPFINDQEILRDYYRAADLFVAPSMAENVGLTIIEASACGTPVVAFATGGITEVILHKQTGYLAQRGNCDELAMGIEYFLENNLLRQQAGIAARQRMVARYSDQDMVAHYIQLYEEILGAEGIHGKVPVVSPTHPHEFVERVNPPGGWEVVWQGFWQSYKKYDPKNREARNIFVDQFYTDCLQKVDVTKDSVVLWEIIEGWLVYRYIPDRCGDLTVEENQALLDFSKTLRSKIHDYLVSSPELYQGGLEAKQETALITVWWHIFLNYFSSMNLQEDRPQKCLKYKQKIMSGINENNKYARLLLASIYDPFHAEDFDLDVLTLWNEPDLPTCYKVILTLWLTNIPYYSIEEKQHERLLRQGADLGEIRVPPARFDLLVGYLSNSFWIASYAGGNHVTALSAFGDFIASHMSRFLPQYSGGKQTEGKARKKIRIGYLSRCFYNQSVSYYMVNRVIHHDPNKFEVYVFALGERHDEISELFANHASYFQRFTNLSSIKPIAQRIIDSQLDILIYTEIGMDPVSYMLAGMQLAPVQCAMVGHGTTTGLPTIQYYISGDFEPPDAQSHYRETLIKLPNLGAAQYPPPFGSTLPSTRKDWNIPEEGIVFVSCANGMKHIPARDRILVNILKAIPNAYIALKPYSSYGNGNQLDARIHRAAQEAGVADRLFIVPPLKHVGPLLAIADVQLDTYPYGGWTTNMEALYMGIPIVTQEGNMARSRWGAHILRAIGIQEGIATSEDEYVEWAVRFAKDKELRQKVKEIMLRQGKDIIFNGEAAQVVYEEVLVEIFNEHKQE